MADPGPASSFEELLLSRVRDVPDHPSPGVLFKDITPLLRDAHAFATTVGRLVDALPADVDVVAGVEARGFILGAPVAAAAGLGFVPVRKAGKLPGPTVDVPYDLEYGSARIEVHADAFDLGRRVVVLDDVLATGGTAAAAAALVERAGGQVGGLLFLMELGSLGGRSRLDGRDVRALVTL